MTAAERQDQIAAMLRTERMVMMKRLAMALGCSMSTVNRDISRCQHRDHQTREG